MTGLIAEYVEPGEIGRAGLDGMPGVAGRPGQKGAPGEYGPNGPVGISGDIGDSIRGFKGLVGEPGVHCHSYLLLRSRLSNLFSNSQANKNSKKFNNSMFLTDILTFNIIGFCNFID